MNNKQEILELYKRLGLNLPRKYSESYMIINNNLVLDEEQSAGPHCFFEKHFIREATDLDRELIPIIRKKEGWL